MTRTLEEFDAVIEHCKELFLKKAKDYGTSWRIMRLSSITDQIFIKAQRIRTLEEGKMAKVDDDIPSEYRGIVNYCVIALMQMELGVGSEESIPVAELETNYDRHIQDARKLMLAKNHDYGEAWRELRISSLTDLILTKILRIKQIENNQGQTLVSEGVNANYLDMLNYAVFALIRVT